MSMREEVDKLVRAAKGAQVTAEEVVEAAKSKRRFPKLHKHLWEVPEEELAAEARIARAHRLLISVRVVTGEGETTRMMVHTRGVPGYQPVAAVAANPNLASLKLRQLSEDISRARARLRSFKAMIPGSLADEIDEALEAAERKAANVNGSHVEMAAA